MGHFTKARVVFCTFSSSRLPGASAFVCLFVRVPVHVPLDLCFFRNQLYVSFFFFFLFFFSALMLRCEYAWLVRSLCRPPAIPPGHCCRPFSLLVEYGTVQRSAFRFTVSVSLGAKQQRNKHPSFDSSLDCCVHACSSRSTMIGNSRVKKMTSRDNLLQELLAGSTEEITNVRSAFRVNCLRLPWLCSFPSLFFFKPKTDTRTKAGEQKTTYFLHTPPIHNLSFSYFRFRTYSIYSLLFSTPPNSYLTRGKLES